MADCCCTPPLNLDPHRGNASAYRRVLWAVLAINAVGRDVWIASQLQSASAKLLDNDENGIFVTAAVRSAALNRTTGSSLSHCSRCQPLF